MRTSQQKVAYVPAKKLRTSRYNFPRFRTTETSFWLALRKIVAAHPLTFCARNASTPGAGAIVAPVSSLLGALHWVSSERLMPALTFVVVLSMLAAPRVVLAICIPDHSLWGGREVEGRAARGVCVVAHASGLFWLRALQAYLGFPRRANRARYMPSFPPGIPSPPTSDSCEVEVPPYYVSLHVRARVSARGIVNSSTRAHGRARPRPRPRAGARRKRPRREGHYLIRRNLLI